MCWSWVTEKWKRTEEGRRSVRRPLNVVLGYHNAAVAKRDVTEDCQILSVRNPI